MEQKFKNWLTMMFNENCLEREADGRPLYKNVEDYTQRNYNWLLTKFKKETGEKS
jgi:hypothetical protein